MEDLRKTKGYNFFAFSGYVIASFNLFLFFLFLFRIGFDLFMFVSFMLLFIMANFILSSITAMYIDFQKDGIIKASDVFYLYGESAYLSLFLIPSVYLGTLKTFRGIDIFAIFFVGLSVWLYRVFMIKKKTGFGFINSLVAVFFPHIILLTSLFIIITTFVYAFIKS